MLVILFNKNELINIIKQLSNAQSTMESYFKKTRGIEKVWLIQETFQDAFYIEFNSLNLFPTFQYLRELEMELKKVTKKELFIVPVHLNKELHLNCFSLIYERLGCM